MIELLLQECGIDVGLFNDVEGCVDKKFFIYLMLVVMCYIEDEFMGLGFGRVFKLGIFSMMVYVVINCVMFEKVICRGIKFYELFDFVVYFRLIFFDDEVIICFEFCGELLFCVYIFEVVVFLILCFFSWLVGQ